MPDDVEVPVGGGVADAYFAAGGDRGHVLFIMDAIGLRPRIAEMVDQVAAQGFTVLAPNLFWRAGRAPVLPLPDIGDPDSRAAFVAAVKPHGAEAEANAAADGAAYLDYLAPEGPVALTGYCIGARIGFRLAAAYPDRVAALGGFHGAQLVTDAAGSPHRLAAAIRAELYFGHADDDPGMPPEAVTELDRALGDAGVRHHSEVYAGARHGFTMADQSVYDADADARHRAALTGLLDRYAA